MEDLLSRNFCSPLIKPKNAAWQAVLHLGKKRRYKKDNLIIGNGELIDQLYYLHSGRVRLSKVMPDGSEKIVWYLDSGNLFGEIAFWDKKPLEGIFVAMEDCLVVAFSRECIRREIMPGHLNLVENMLEGLAHKARVVATQASDITSLKSRLCKLLIYMVERETEGIPSGKVVCKRSLSQQELAGLLGIHRVTLNHMIAQLKKEGMIEAVGKGRMTVADFDSLVKCASI
jgi:CRP-like cAMP-binding protein